MLGLPAHSIPASTAQAPGTHPSILGPSTADLCWKTWSGCAWDLSCWSRAEATQEGTAGYITAPWCLWWGQILHIQHKHWPLCFSKGFAHLNPSMASAKAQKTARTVWEATSELIIQGLWPPPTTTPQGSSLGLSEKTSTPYIREQLSQICTVIQNKKPNRSSLHSACVNIEMNMISPLLIANTGHSLNKTICICYLIRPQVFKWRKNNSLRNKSFLWASFLSFNLVCCWVL